MEVLICTCEMDVVRAHRWSQQNNGHVQLEGLGELRTLYMHIYSHYQKYRDAINLSSLSGFVVVYFVYLIQP